MALVHVASQGSITILKDTVVDLNTKTFDFTTDIQPLLSGAPRVVQVVGGLVKLVTNATTTTRLICMEILDASSNILFRCGGTGGVVMTGTTTYNIPFTMAARPTDANLTGQGGREQIPDKMYLWAGLKLKVYDISNVGPGADDMEVTLHFAVETGAI